MEILTLKTKLDYERKEHCIYLIIKNNGKSKNRKNMMISKDTMFRRLADYKLKPQITQSQSTSGRLSAIREPTCWIL